MSQPVIQKTGASPASAKSDSTADRYNAVRAFSERLAEPLSPEDCAVQSMPDTSPVKWHLAHTTWFFETFLLKDRPGYRRFDDRFTDLFNSYYNAVGEQFTRAHRGVLSRPSFEEVLDYRRHIDAAMAPLLAGGEAETQRVVEIGLHHEQQHQELILTDVKHALWCNPLGPAYEASPLAEPAQASGGWAGHEGGVREIGHSGTGFSFDNESPRHRVFVEPFELAEPTVTCGEYLRFMADGGYQRPELWLSLGWAAVGQHGWNAPAYWRESAGGEWEQFTLAGWAPVDEDRPVCHVSFFEADAYARWTREQGQATRLPTEAEWELACHALPTGGGFVDSMLANGSCIHPGRVWEWTASPYSAYPGYDPPDGALGEYNGKFMCNQYVLRGGSCATHSTHYRPTYRNFFPPDARWQFTGIRLAR